MSYSSRNTHPRTAQMPRSGSRKGAGTLVVIEVFEDLDDLVTGDAARSYDRGVLRYLHYLRTVKSAGDWTNGFRMDVPEAEAKAEARHTKCVHKATMLTVNTLLVHLYYANGLGC